MTPRLALVTGAAGAIGSGVARMLAARGYRVVCVDRDAAAVARVADQVGGIAVPSDATDPAQSAALADRIRGEWATQLDVLVCNAGVIVPGPVTELAVTSLDLHLDVMLREPMRLIAAAVPAMVARGGGHVLATVSMGGILPLPGSAAYSAAKAGLRAYLMALSAELTGSGVAVSGIYPSGVDTPMLRIEARHNGSKLNWLGKVFTVDDVVGAYERALRSRRLEVYLPWSDSVSTRLSMAFPSVANRLIPFFERAATKRHAAYLARIDAEERGD